MRLGAYDCEIKIGTRTYAAYEEKIISERHRHRYEFNNKYKKILEKNGLIFSGINKELKINFFGGFQTSGVHLTHGLVFCVGSG